MKYYLIAGEASGDLHGANLMKGLLKADPQARFRFWGGDKMAAVGGAENLAMHYKKASFMGFVEIAKNLRTILGQIAACKEDVVFDRLFIEEEAQERGTDAGDGDQGVDHGSTGLRKSQPFGGIGGDPEGDGREGHLGDGADEHIKEEALQAEDLRKALEAGGGFRGKGDDAGSFQREKV